MDRTYYNPEQLEQVRLQEQHEVRRVIEGVDSSPQFPIPFSWSDNYRGLLDRMLAIHKAKAADYTGGSADPLSNYRQSAQVAGVDAKRIMLARVQEKVKRLSVLLSPNHDTQVKDESVEDTLLDIANIALLIRNDIEWEQHDSAGRRAAISATLMNSVGE